MAVRVIVQGSLYAMLESRQATKADERAHAQRWRATYPDHLVIELHSAAADDVQAMLRALHLVQVDTHRRPDGGIELLGLALRDPERPRAAPRPLHCGATLIQE